MKLLIGLKNTYQELILIIVRISYGLLWLDGGVSWKRPPLFGLDNGQNLYAWVINATKYEVLPIYTSLIQLIILPHFLFFAWMVYAIELTLGIGFIRGLRTKYLALLALFQTANITLSAINQPSEWRWSYFLMFMVALVLFARDTSESKFSLDYWINSLVKR